MKIIFNRIFNIFLILILIIGSAIFVITTYFADDIENAVIEKIQANLTTPLTLDDVEFTIYDNFPSTSVKFNNLLVLESVDFGNDTLLYAKEAYVNISITEVLSNNFDISKIIISNGKVNIKYNENKIPNFLIGKEISDSKGNVNIEEIVLLNTAVLVENLSSELNMNLQTERVIIVINNSKIELQTIAFSKNLTVGKIDYLSKKNLDINAELNIRKDTIDILNSNIQIGSLFANGSGRILRNRHFNLAINLQDEKINNVISNLPQNIKKICNPFVLDGEITSDIKITGIISKNTNPLFEMNYVINNGGFELKSRPFKLKNIAINGTVSNGEKHNFNTTKIIASDFKSNTNEGYLNGIFSLQNLNNYYFKSNFNSSWDLKEVNTYFEDSPFTNLQGEIVATTNYNGEISFDNKFKNKFLNATHTSDVKFENISFSYKKFPLPFTLDFGDCQLKNNKIIFKNSSSTISESDLRFVGETTDLIAYILNKKDKIAISGDLTSTYTNLKQLMTLGDISEDQSSTTFPNWIKANINTEIANLSYDNFTATNLSGNIQYNNGTLKGFNMSGNSLDGNISGYFIFTEPKNKHLMLLGDINFTKINIRNSFHAFNNYGQAFINENEIKGLGTAEVNIEAHWKPDFILDEEKLKLKSHLIIEKGELIDFKTLENLSSYVSVEELKHVKFSTLENNIEVENKIITIPNMEIKSSALSVFISGSHTFNQDINYDIKLLLSELLSTSFRKKNTEFGEEEQDGKIFNTVYLKMTGNTEDPKITLDKIRFMEDVSDGIKVEKTNISNIIKEDILKTKDKEVEEAGQEVEIEWNPEN